jgi:hypothetical protein
LYEEVREEREERQARRMAWPSSGFSPVAVVKPYDKESEREKREAPLLSDGWNGLLSCRGETACPSVPRHVHVHVHVHVETAGVDNDALHS